MVNRKNSKYVFWDKLIVKLGSECEYPCPDCGKRMFLRHNRKLNKLYYLCEDLLCGGNCSTYPNGTPLGIPVNRDLRRERRDIHTLFEETYRKLGYSRTNAYKALGRFFGIDSSKHIAEMTSMIEFDQVRDFCGQVNNGDLDIDLWAVGIRKRDWREL